MFRTYVMAIACALIAIGPDAAIAGPTGGPCVPVAGVPITCGLDAGAVMVLEDTVSPSGELAIAWWSPGKDGLGVPDDVEHHLLRLSDGKLLGRTVGRYWTDGKIHANRIDVHARWSRDSRWLVLGDTGRWSLDGLAVYRVSENLERMVGLDLRDLVNAAGLRALRRAKGEKRAAAYIMYMSGDRKIEVSPSGVVSLPITFLIPKQNADVDFRLRLQVIERGDQLSARLLSITRTR